MLHRGRWAEPVMGRDGGRVWVPPGCMLYHYTPLHIHNCLWNRSLSIRGDDTAHQLFQTLLASLDVSAVAPEWNNSGKNITLFTNGSRISFVWDELLNSNQILDMKPPGSVRAYMQSLAVEMYDDHAEVSMNSAGLVALERSHRPHLDHFPEYNIDHSTNSFNVAKSLEVYSIMVDDWPSIWRHNDMSIDHQIMSAQAQVLFNHLCVDTVDRASKESRAYCCARYMKSTVFQKSLICAGTCMAVCLVLFPVSLWKKLCCSQSIGSLSISAPSQIVGPFARLWFAGIYCYVADRTMYFEKSPKVVDLGMFLFMMIIAFVAGLATLQSAQPQETKYQQSTSDTTVPRHMLLSRLQTEEWKGWMQIVILLYHYFGMSRVLWVYQLVRLLVASYLFMTGYGHTMYFLTSNDFSFRRLVNVTLRTNMLNILLAFVMGTQYDLYYFPALSTIWFLIIWITVPRVTSAGVQMLRVMMRILASAAVVSVTISHSHIVQGWLANVDSLGLHILKIEAHEFLFRFRLDAYVVFAGMLAALGCSRYRCDSTRPHGLTPAWNCLMATLIILGPISIIALYGVFCRQFEDKYSYNRWHPFLSPWPVMAYAILRNSTDRMRACHSRIFAWFGRCSLETFVLQYHIWLAADSRGVLRLGLANKLLHTYQIKWSFWFDLVDFAIISVLFLWVGNLTAGAVPTLTRVFIRDDIGTPGLGQHPDNDTISALLSKKSTIIGLRARVFIGLIALWVLNITWYHLI